VDSKGRLFRRELDQGDKSFGEMKHPPIVDYFFAHMQRNDTVCASGIARRPMPRTAKFYRHSSCRVSYVPPPVRNDCYFALVRTLETRNLRIEPHAWIDIAKPSLWMLRHP
jgi:hypothetical protein